MFVGSLETVVHTRMRTTSSLRLVVKLRDIMVDNTTKVYLADYKWHDSRLRHCKVINCVPYLTWRTFLQLPPNSRTLSIIDVDR